MSEKIFVTRKLPGNALDQLKREYEVDIWDHENPPTNEEIIARARDCIGLVSLLSDTIDERTIRALPMLKIIAQYAVGYNNIDIGTATQQGIMVTNTPGVLTETTADLTWALILSVARRIVESDKYVRSGKWKVAWGPEMLLGVDIFDSTIGIIGMGRIGYAVAKRATGFGMRILYHSHSQTQITKDADMILHAERTSFEDLLSSSDIVSIHVPLTEQTRNLINNDSLSLMKPNAILVNTSRGPVVNEQDLFETLIRRRIGGAGLDVFNKEPTPLTNPLLDLDNIVVLPHIGSATTTTRTRMAEMVVENLLKGLKGIEPPNIVNPEAIQ